MAATNDLVKRLIDAGLSFTQMTQAKAEDIVKEMQEAGQLRMEEAQTTIQELIEAGRKNTEELARTVQREVSRQLQSFGIDLGDLEARIDDLARRVGLVRPPVATTASATAAAASPAKKSTAKKVDDEGRDEEDGGQEDHGQEDDGEEDGGQEVHGEEVDGRPRRRRARRGSQRPSGRRPGRPQRRRRPAAERPRRGPVTVRRRLDVELVRRGLAPSRAVAHAAIAEHRVTVGGALAAKPSRLVRAVGSGRGDGAAGPFRRARWRQARRRGSTDFAIDVSGCRALDAGASTGGFTDCLLQRGAAQVVAVDVGHGQLHPAIRDDPRVVVRERCNVRHLGAGDVGGVVDLVVADLSFISLVPVLPALLGVCRPDAPLVLLVKPQFEAGRAQVYARPGRGPRPRRAHRGADPDR